VSQPSKNRTCFYCTQFRNSPAYLESVYKGLSSLSSAHASVRKDDGICLFHDVYLSANDWCDDFQAAEGRQAGAAVK
jgi:hypothetical protein